MTTKVTIGWSKKMVKYSLGLQGKKHTNSWFNKLTVRVLIAHKDSQESAYARY